MTDDLVATQTRRGISWNLVSALIVNVVRIGVISVLGRTLVKADFGVVAAAVTVNVVIFSVRDLGMGPALVQRPTVTPAHFTTAFAVSILLGAAATLGLLVAAPVIASAYHMPQLTNIVRGLAPLFIIGGLSLVSRAQCQRSLRFRTIALIDTFAFLAGAAVSITLAISHFGAWALVLGYLVEELVGSVAYVVARPPSVSLRVDRASFRDLMGFGGWQIVSNIAGNLAVNADNVVVGRSIGATGLGYYARAYDLMKFPSQVFTAIVGNVLFPSFSRMQADQARVADGFCRGLLVNALVLLPGSALLIVCAPEVIRILFGPDWDGAVLSFRILTVTMMFRTSQKLAILVVLAAGRVEIVALLNIFYMAFIFCAALVTVRWGIAAVAVSTGCAIIGMTIATAGFAKSVSGVTWAAMGRAHIPGALAAVVVGLTCWPAAAAVRTKLSGPLVLVVVISLLAATGAALTVWLARRCFWNEWQWLAGQVVRGRAQLKKTVIAS
ncbi:MAG: lipopolysaccharide biosynthesis protein [Kofleriaceae bacterium]|nr:lipopolysaccharide biosynthesis protein [Kofleriaceae bacterium]